MGAGMTQNVQRCRMYRILKGYAKELRDAGVRCDYHKKAVRSNTCNYFIVSFGETIQASNGESFAFGVIDVLNPDTNVIEQYRFLDMQHGIDRIKTLYGNDLWKFQARERTDNAWLIVQVERHVRLKDDKVDNLFLYNADDSLFPTIPCGGMERGQIFAYNEMKDDKPMIRIGTGVDPTQYTELLPGMSVRYRDGRTFVKRPSTL